MQENEHSSYAIILECLALLTYYFLSYNLDFPLKYGDEILFKLL